MRVRVLSIPRSDRVFVFVFLFSSLTLFGGKARVLRFRFSSSQVGLRLRAFDLFGQVKQAVTNRPAEVYLGRNLFGLTC